MSIERGTGRSLLASLGEPETAVVVYLRMLAIAFLLAGFSRWLLLLELPDRPSGALLDLPLHLRVETIAYAVLDPVVAVGLWLTTAWGIVVWLIAAISRIVLASGFAPAAEPDLPQLGIQIASIVIYLGLSHIMRRATAEREKTEGT